MQFYFYYLFDYFRSSHNLDYYKWQHHIHNFLCSANFYFILSNCCLYFVAKTIRIIQVLQLKHYCLNNYYLFICLINYCFSIEYITYRQGNIINLSLYFGYLMGSIVCGLMEYKSQIGILCLFSLSWFDNWELLFRLQNVQVELVEFIDKMNSNFN